MRAHCSCPVTELSAGAWSDAVNGRGENVQRQELPEEPLRPAWPERQRRELLPILGNARLAGGREIGRIERDRHQNERRRDERQQESQQPVRQEWPSSLAH